MDTQTCAQLREAVYQYSTLTASEQIDTVTEVITSGRLGSIAGHTVREFEEQVSAHMGRTGAVATASATAALELLLHCLPVREPRERVVVPAVGWITIPTAVARTGRIPVVAPVTADLTPHWEQIEPLLDERTTAVVLAHLRGRPAPDTPRIADELARRGVMLIEDCAQAWGATVDGVPVGRHGQAALFSTQTYKLIATGEGGIVAADDSNLLTTLRATGGDTRVTLPEGFHGRGNARMSEITAASALPQLAYLGRLRQLLRPLQTSVIDRLSSVAHARGVLPVTDATQANLGAEASNGSLVGVWLTSGEQAERVADRLFQLGIRHWWPGPGDPHLAENWNNATGSRGDVDMTRYLDIQIPVLDESRHPGFVDLIHSALTDDHPAGGRA